MLNHSHMPDSPYLQVALPRVNPRIRWITYLDAPLPAVNPRVNFDYNYQHDAASHTASAPEYLHSYSGFHPSFSPSGLLAYTTTTTPSPHTPVPASAPHLFTPSYSASPAVGEYLFENDGSDDADSVHGLLQVGIKRRSPSVSTAQLATLQDIQAVADGLPASDRRASKRKKTAPLRLDQEQWIYPAPPGEPGKETQGGHSLPKELEKAGWSKSDVKKLRVRFSLSSGTFG